MLGHKFYHRLIRKYVIAFGSLFNDMQVERVGKNGKTKEIIKVPISYGPTEKFLERLSTNKDLEKEVSITVPRMGFEMTGIQYNPTTKVNTLNKYVSKNPDTNDTVYTAFTQVPYDIGFDLTIFVKNSEDGTQLIEQILPFFTPEFNTTINLVPEIQNPFDIPIILNSVEQQDEYDGDFETRRLITWNLSFTMKGLFIGPVRTSDRPIKTAILNTGDITNNVTSGTVTTAPTIVGKTIDEISVDDDFGFNTTIE